MQKFSSGSSFSLRPHRLRTETRREDNRSPGQRNRVHVRCGRILVLELPHERNCFGDTSVTCNGSTNTTGESTPAHQVSFKVRGATYSFFCRMAEWQLSTAKASLRSTWQGMPVITGVVACHWWTTSRRSLTATRQS